ncbi:SDR family NAD(P)-dependent oxidoreductase [Microbulbifer sp. THAF38]|uniref:SDR family NAD(P)-dependent oxidoreductase n=1 Tax=Microbulbifer sp. THAF38 TaxID=2587856 RepID=UPI0012684005|nr:SDR family NAD(P)-dependent oxidoreductase [Microbulbifer sp. THAF38]QFT54840.1 Fatty acyl-CoA reductase [Microbulbifer sp. THAF38]
MAKTILLTGATDGIGLETAKLLASKGHTLLLHGRSKSKLKNIQESISQDYPDTHLEIFLADLSDLSDVEALASQVKSRYSSIDILINNAGVFKTDNPTTDAGYDIRFIVNVIAPYLLTKRLLPLFNTEGRIINLSSAAQAPVSLQALKGEQILSDSDAYAQSKLALTMWTFQLAKLLDESAPDLIAINPASFLGSKMVKEAYGSLGRDLSIGANILVRAALSDEFSGNSGKYFDNDLGNWSPPHPDALDESLNIALIEEIIDIADKLGIKDA